MNARDSSNSCVGFAGEAGHHVGADGAIRHQRASLENAVGIMTRAVLAMHAAQHAYPSPIAAARARAWRCAASRPSAPVESSEKSIGSTELRRRRSTGVSSSSRRTRSTSRLPPSEIAAPAAQVDPAQHHFAIFRRQCADLLDHGFRRRAAAAAAHVRNNAERAAVVAAVLNLEIRARAVARGVFDRRGKKIALRENIADVDLVRDNAHRRRPDRGCEFLCEFPTTRSRLRARRFPPAHAARSSR